MQPVYKTVSTRRHTGRDLAGHPRCVNVGNDYGKTRLFTPIRLKTIALPWCARHHSAQRGRPSPPRRGDESAGKICWSHRNSSSSPERVRLLQLLLPRPQKRQRPETYSRSQTPDNWLILAQSQAVLTSHKTLLLSHLGCLGLRVNFAKSILSLSQRVSFLGTVIVSVQMTPTVSAE